MTNKPILKPKENQRGFLVITIVETIIIKLSCTLYHLDVCLNHCVHVTHYADTEIVIAEFATTENQGVHQRHNKARGSKQDKFPRRIVITKLNLF